MNDERSDSNATDKSEKSPTRSTAENSRPPIGNRPSPPKRGGVSIARLALKELRETLRDRRTIITLIAMPLIVYPILSIAFRTFLLSQLPTSTDQPVQYRYAVETEMSAEQLMVFLKRVDEGIRVAGEFSQRAAGLTTSTNPPNPPENSDIDSKEKANPLTSKVTVREATFGDHDWNWLETSSQPADDILKMDEADAIVKIVTRESATGYRNTIAEVVYNEQSARSRNAARFLKGQLETYNRFIFQGRLMEAKLNSALPLAVQERLVAVESKGGGMSLTAIIPLILVLMTITGAVYPAIDLTAGERERGTLETLIAAPLPRLKILLAKLSAVLTVSVLTATLNLIGMMATVWTFRLDELLLGEQGMQWSMVVKIFALLILFATFFSSVMLVITSFARSFKEAQAYLIPLILVSLAPGLMAMTPGLSLSGPLAACPLLNLLLLARDILDNQVSLVPATVAIVTTLLYASAAIALAASIFGSDSILYGSQAGWKEMWIRPARRQVIAPLPVAIGCLVLLLPVNFLLIGFLSRVEESVVVRLGLMSLFTIFAFAVIPAIIAWHQRIRWRTGFGILSAPSRYFWLAMALGLTLWPLVASFVSWWHEFISLVSGNDAGKLWADRLVELSKSQAEKFRQAPPALILWSMAIVPAVCEEFFFRGMLLRSLVRLGRIWIPVLVSALAFGAFHTLSGSAVALDRLIPTISVGILLGWLAVQCKSTLPGMVLHAIHNGSVAFLAYYQPALSRLPWFPQEDQPVPIYWTAIATGVVSVCLFVLWRSKRQDLSPGDELSRVKIGVEK